MTATAFEAFPDPKDPVRVLSCHGHPAHAVGVRFGPSFTDSSCLYLTHFQARTVLRQLQAIYAPLDPAPPAEAPPTPLPSPLDDARRAIDALGGWFNRANPESAAYDRALGDAIRAVEALGGRNPAAQA